MNQLNINTRKASYRLQNGILICELKPDLIIDLKTAVSLVNERIKITKGHKFPFMLVIKNYLLLDNDAFKYFGTNEGVQNLIASAVIIESPLQKLITNFSLFFYKNSVPFRVFNQEKEAQLWLFEYIKKSQGHLTDDLLSS